VIGDSFFIVSSKGRVGVTHQTYPLDARRHIASEPVEG
jgi:hypothetical protein